MKIKSLIPLKCIALFLFSCTIDANLNKDYKNKVEELLNSSTDDQAKISINKSSNATKNKTNIKVAGPQKNTQSGKNNNLQGLKPANQVNPGNLIQIANQAGQAGPASQASPVASPANPVVSPATNVQATPPKQIASAQAIQTVPNNTSTPNQSIIKPQQYTFSSSFSQPTSQTNFNNSQSNNVPTNYRHQTQPSFVAPVYSGNSPLQKLKNNLLRRIAEEKNKTHNHGFRETYDQFKMKDSAFTLLDVISNISVFDRGSAPQLSSNTPEAENERNRLYAMMDFDQAKTTKFGSIMDTLYQEDQNHSLIRSLIISGLGIQVSLENALEEIEKKIEIFNTEYLRTTINSYRFTDKLNELESKLNSILTEKKEWLNCADAIIANTSSNSNRNDPQSLGQYIENRYLDKMQDARQSALDLYVNITEIR
ncbi:Antigen, P35, putative (plasmid) [Borreliella garinii BgVir]|uniref:complement regulator-acquiring protein n=1 Tax=Borreliella garinii TaxID=29519 RepID=UPI000242FA0B|nr:complement regulator-acquiring protein [Borreliella garinii]AEW69218.1 Antigen, P35, putative [Borreliella garinii BgVir]